MRRAADTDPFVSLRYRIRTRADSPVDGAIDGGSGRTTWALIRLLDQEQIAH